MKTTMLGLMLVTLLAAVAMAPSASAANAYLYNCVRTGTNAYSCGGYGQNNAGEICSVEWTDNDANDDWEDSGAVIQSIDCGGAILENPMPVPVGPIN